MGNWNSNRRVALSFHLQLKDLRTKQMILSTKLKFMIFFQTSFSLSHGFVWLSHSHWTENDLLKSNRLFSVSQDLSLPEVSVNWISKFGKESTPTPCFLKCRKHSLTKSCTCMQVWITATSFSVLLSFKSFSSSQFKEMAHFTPMFLQRILDLTAIYKRLLLKMRKKSQLFPQIRSLIPGFSPQLREPSAETPGNSCKARTFRSTDIYFCPSELGQVFTLCSLFIPRNMHRGLSKISTWDRLDQAHQCSTLISMS